MKTCSKCGRSYPDHVDFCLRDGHPLVAQEAPGLGGAAEGKGSGPRAEGQSGDSGAMAIDLQATTDAFFPGLQASLLGEDGEASEPATAETAPGPAAGVRGGTAPKAQGGAGGPRSPEAPPRAHRIESLMGGGGMGAFGAEVQSTEEIASVHRAEVGEPHHHEGGIDPESDLIKTDVISVSRVREVVARHREGQPISLLNPKALDPQSMVQTDLIPRNWRGQLAEAGELPPDLAEGEDLGEGAESTDPAAQSLPADPEAAPGEISEEVDTDPRGARSTGGAPPSRPAPDAPERGEEPEDYEALRRTGTTRRAGVSMPFVFEGEEVEGIPSGFEDSAPPEEGDVENTGVLSRSFIQRTVQEAAKATAPWEDKGKAEQPFIPRGERGERVAALEEEDWQAGAPPKGAFRKRAAFSHWSTPTVEEPPPADEDEALPELGPGSIETAEMKIPPPSAPEADPWAEPMASSTVMTAAPTGPHAGAEAEPAPPPSRGWILAFLAVLVIGVGAVMGFSMKKGSGEVAPQAANPSVQVERPAPVAVAPKPSEGIDITRSAPMPIEAGEAAPQTPPAEAAQVANVEAALVDPERFGAQGQPAATAAPPRPPAVAQAPKAKMATLVVGAEPPGARVSVDGRDVGAAPQSVSLEGGRHVVRVEKAGFEPLEKRITLEAGLREEIRFTLAPKARPTPRPTTMRLIITSSVQGAEAYVDGKLVGKTPATFQARSGKHEVKVMAQGSAPYVTEVDIPNTSDPQTFRRVHAQF